jgi:hypothetical protein
MGTVAGLLSNDQYQELYAKQNALTLATGIQTFLATPTSSNLAAAISDEAGSSSLVFSNNPTLTNTTLSGTLTLTTPLSVANGGTGTNTYLKGDILYASAANTLSKLPIGTEGQVLLTSSSLVPVWGSNGVYSLNGQSAITHTLTSSTFSITSATSSNTATHTFSLLDATASNRGLMSTADQIFEGNKTFNKDIIANSTYFGRGNSQGTNSPGIANNLSIGVGSKNFSTNTSGNYNIAIGASSLITLTGGTNNNAVGYYALKMNTDGSSNNAFGANALSNNTSGINNTAVGEGALSLNAGTQALGYGSNNTAVGFASLTSNVSGYQNTAIGSTSGVATNNLSNATAIGFGARVNADNTIQLGNTSVTSVVTSGTLSATGATLSGTLSATNATLANLKFTKGTPTNTGAVLIATATDGTVGWSTSSSASSLSGGVAGSIPFQTAPNVTGFTAAGTSGQILVSAGTATPTWTSNITVGTATATSVVTSGLKVTSGSPTAGSILTANNADGTVGFTAQGTSGQILISAGTSTPTWTSNITVGTATATSVVTNTLKVTGGIYTTTGAVLTSDGAGNAIWGNNGLYSLNGLSASSHVFATTNSATSDFTITSSVSGGTATHTFNLPDASATARGAVSTSAQTFAGNKKFNVAVTGASAFGTTLNTIDFANSNLAYTSYTTSSNPTFTLNNLKDGGTYTLAWQNTRTGSTANFQGTYSSGNNYTFKSLGNYQCVATYDAVYTFVVMGTTVYYSMATVQ